MSDIKTKQLYEKKESEYVPIYPLLSLQKLLDEASGDDLLSLLFKINHVYVEDADTKAVARTNVNSIFRRRGLFITYYCDGKLYTETFTGSNSDAKDDVKWCSDEYWEVIPDLEFVQSNASKIPDGAILPEHLSESLQQLISDTHYITNLPDDEDLCSTGCNILKFKDKLYEPILASGKGYKTLRKNWVNGKNILQQASVSDDNVIYEVRYDFDLNGKTITLGENSGFFFKGGSINNGTVVFDGGSIYNADSFDDCGDASFTGVFVKGLIMLVDGTPKWFNGTDWVSFSYGSGGGGDTDISSLSVEAEAVSVASTAIAVATANIAGSVMSFKFEIPRGADGAAGKDGKDGTDGKDGADGKDGTDGTNGVVPNYKNYIYYKSDTKPDKPTGTSLPSDWSDYPDDSGQWWQCIATINGETEEVISFSEVLPVNGRDGEAQDGKHVEFRFALGSSSSTAPTISVSSRTPDGWSLAAPQVEDGTYLWMTYATINADDTLYGVWSTPVRISGEKGLKGDTGPAGERGPTGSQGVSGIPGVTYEKRYSLGTKDTYLKDFDSDIAADRECGTWTLAKPAVTTAYPCIWFVEARIAFESADDTTGFLEDGVWNNPERETAVDGADGTVPNWKTYVYQQAASKPDKPTEMVVEPTGWEDIPVNENDTATQWWQCIGTVDGTSAPNYVVLEWSDVLPVNGQDGDAKDGKYTEFRFKLGTSATTAPTISTSAVAPSGWSKTAPSIEAGTFLWMTTATFNADGTLDGVWSDPVRISGENGTDAINAFKSTVFIRQNATPDTPDETKGTLYNNYDYPWPDPDTGWTDGIPDGEEILWASTRVFYSDDSESTYWSTPARMTDTADFDVEFSTVTSPGNPTDNPDNWSNDSDSTTIWMAVRTKSNGVWGNWKISRIKGEKGDKGDAGADGADGTSGKRGQIMFPAGTFSKSKTYTTDEYKAPYVYDSSDDNFYVLNAIGDWSASDRTEGVDDTPALDYAKYGGSYWLKMEAFEALYAKIGIFGNALVGSAVFNGDYMFSQQGIDTDGNTSTHYEYFALDSSGNTVAPYDSTAVFRPNICFNFKTGECWLGQGKVNIDSNGNLILNSGFSEYWKQVSVGEETSTSYKTWQILTLSCESQNVLITSVYDSYKGLAVYLDNTFEVGRVYRLRFVSISAGAYISFAPVLGSGKSWTTFSFMSDVTTMSSSGGTIVLGSLAYCDVIAIPTGEGENGRMIADFYLISHIYGSVKWEPSSTVTGDYYMVSVLNS